MGSGRGWNRKRYRSGEAFRGLSVRRWTYIPPLLADRPASTLAIHSCLNAIPAHSYIPDSAAFAPKRILSLATLISPLLLALPLKMGAEENTTTAAAVQKASQDKMYHNDKSVPWWTDNPVISWPARYMLHKYSGIPAQEIDEIVMALVWTQ
jgi:hypothetical protein